MHNLVSTSIALFLFTVVHMYASDVDTIHVSKERTHHELSRITKRTDGEYVFITVQTEQEQTTFYKGEGLQVNHDSAMWRLSNGNSMTVAMDNVMSIAVQPSSGIGTGLGIAIGAVVGGLVGMGLGVAASEKDKSASIVMSEEQANGIGGLFLGSLFGGIVGGFLGGPTDGTTWVFSH